MTTTTATTPDLAGRWCQVLGEPEADALQYDVSLGLDAYDAADFGVYRKDGTFIVNETGRARRASPSPDAKVETAWVGLLGGYARIGRIEAAGASYPVADLVALRPDLKTLLDTCSSE